MYVQSLRVDTPWVLNKKEQEKNSSKETMDDIFFNHYVLGYPRTLVVEPLNEQCVCVCFPVVI